MHENFIDINKIIIVKLEKIIYLSLTDMANMEFQLEQANMIKLLMAEMKDMKVSTLQLKY